MKKLFLFLGSTILISGCISMQIITDTPFIKTNTVKKIAIIEVMVGKPIQAIFPLIDAGIFNQKMNKISDQIMDIERKKASLYRDALATQMEKKFGCEIIYGKKLQELPNYEILRKDLENKNALLTENDNFPAVFLADGEFNAFSFEKGKVNTYFSKNLSTSTAAIELCKNLDVDAVAISYTHIYTHNVTSFGFSANMRLFTYLYILDKKGVKIGEGSGLSNLVSIRGKEAVDYNLVLDEFNILINPLTTQLLSPTSR